MEKFPSELSGGMTKRVALARALALEPDIVFLDEPTSGLDPIAAGDFDILIKTLQQTLGLTVFMVTHDLDSLEAVCDRVAALADGRIVAARADGDHAGLPAPLGEGLFRRPARAGWQQGGGSAARSPEAAPMETNARYLTIGCFALAAIVACLGFVFWLNRSGGLAQQEIYQVRFGNQVSGLQPGAAVLFDGMRVGSVSRLDLDPQDPRHVVATLAVAAGTPVRQDTGSASRARA